MQHTLPVTWAPRILWHDPRFGDSWLDLFIYRVDSRDGLPPSARAEAIKGLMRQLKRYRTYPCLWVQVDSPGPWYVTALRWALTDFGLDVAILPVGSELSAVDFLTLLPPIFSRRPSKPSFDCLPFEDTALSKSQKAELRVLRCMARMEYAGAKEIASLAGFGVTYTRKILARLHAGGFIKPSDGMSGRQKQKDPTWMIKRPGIQYVYRSWNIPHGIPFKHKRLEQKYAGRKHRKMSRLFRTRLQKAYGGDFEIWQSWSEPDLATEYPDAIVWGTYEGVETLVWMEVETGKKKAKRHAKDIEDRYWQANLVVKRHKIQLVFVFLSMPWVLRGVAKLARFRTTENTALIFDNWRDHDHLARPVFGRANSLSFEHGFKMPKKTCGASKDPSFFDNFQKK